jgi:L-aspartate oxidase
MALRAGAALLDMEFVQFHPTALALPGAPRFLISEAVRGEGAYLRNAAGERFTDELAPRDQVARAIARENRDGRGPVVLDLSHLDPERVRARFPRIVATCRRYGVDPTRDPVPVTPAAHYVMGGAATDLHARATLPGLYAAGEAAGTGVHGANRLASNSLLEGLVFGARAADAMAADSNQLHVPPLPERESGSPPLRERERGRGEGPDNRQQDSGDGSLGAIREELQHRAWAGLGLERDGAGLAGLERWLDGRRATAPARPRDRAAAEDRNLLDVAWAMAVSARFREESRGSHYRLDFQRPDDRFLGHTLLADAAPRLVDVETPIPEGAPC